MAEVANTVSTVRRAGADPMRNAGGVSLRDVINKVAGSPRLLYGGWLLYSTIVVLAVRRHEPWADEAQAWLIARDSTLVQLWTSLGRYEGTPPLWHTLLQALQGLGLPYDLLNLFSAALAGRSASPAPVQLLSVLPVCCCREELQPATSTLVWRCGPVQGGATTFVGFHVASMLAGGGQRPRLCALSGTGTRMALATLGQF